MIKQLLLQLQRKLQGKNGGIIKQSSKNIGMKDSRQVYRMTYLLRLPTFKKGDFIRFNKKYYIVKSFSAEKVKLIDLSHWNEIIFKIKNLENAKVIGGKELVKEAILLSQTKSEVQIMDKKNYQTFYLKKPYDLFLSSKKIKFAKIEGEIFLFFENCINHKY